MPRMNLGSDHPEEDDIERDEKDPKEQDDDEEEGTKSDEQITRRKGIVW